MMLSVNLPRVKNPYFIYLTCWVYGFGFSSFCRPNPFVLELRGSLVFFQKYTSSLLVVTLIRRKTLFNGEEEENLCPWTYVSVKSPNHVNLVFSLCTYILVAC